MSDSDIERAVGRLEGKLSELATTVDRNRDEAQTERAILVAKIDALNSSVSSMTDTVNRVRGGWAMLTVLGSVAAAIGAAITWFMSHVTVH